MKKTTLLAGAAAMLLAASCGERTRGDNPFFAAEWDTPFGVPPFDRIRPEHFVPAIEEGIARENAEIRAIVDNRAEPSFDNTILAYDNSGQFLSRVVSVFSGLNGANTNDTLRDINQLITPMLSRHASAIAMDPGLFARVRSVYERRESLGLDALQLRLLDKIYKSFERAGAALSAEDQAALKQVDEVLSVLQLDFGNHLLADTKEFVLTLVDSADLAGLPASVVEAAAATAAGRGETGWTFTLDKPSWIPFLQYSPRADLRERLYNGYLTMGMRGNANDNRAVATEIARLRVEKAQLLGFATWSDYVLDRVMAKTPARVYELLDQVWAPALDRARAELAEMEAIRAAEGARGEFLPSDWWYYAEKLRAARYDLDENELRPYFSLETVREGIFRLADSLYGIRFVTLPEAPKYHPDNQVYRVLDTDSTLLGVLYMDFFPRAGKRGGAWCGSYRPQAYADGERVAPVMTLVCNFTPPTADGPSLLSIDETETFFHEFGHALHGLFSDVPYRGLRGTERDFVELPSQIMENWAMDPEFLVLYAKHYRTGETIPADLLARLSNGRLFNQGFMTTELTAASIIDMDLHTLTAVPAGFDLMAFQRRSLDRRGLIPQIAPRYQYPYFNHIFNSGYSSGYYSYTWSEVLDADAYDAFAETGNIFDAATAARFRTLLEKGGTEEGMALYLEFRGRQPSRDPLLRNRGLLR